MCVFLHRNGYCPFSNIYEVNVSYFIGLRLKAQPSFLISSVSCAALKWGVKGKGIGGGGVGGTNFRETNHDKRESSGSAAEQITESLSEQVSTSCLAPTEKKWVNSSSVPITQFIALLPGVVKRYAALAAILVGLQQANTGSSK